MKIIKKILLMVVGIGLTTATIVKNGNNEINEALDVLQNLLQTESNLVEKLKVYINEHQQTTFVSNTEYYLRELIEVSNSVNQHLLSSKKMVYLLKKLKSLLGQIKDPHISDIVSPAILQNITTLQSEEHNNFQDDVFEESTLELCKGESLLTPDIQKDLKCRYIDRGNLYLKIAPIKEEEIYLDPDIFMYHNVMNDEEIKFLKTQSHLMLSESLIETINGPSKLRVSKNAWLRDTDHKYVENISRRIEHITNLGTQTAEDLQVAYYKKGGYYMEHYDFDSNKTHPFYNDGGPFDGNRIATFMFYLNDVEEGGRTVFPYLNVSLTPEKGSAIFWYNIFPNGELDYYTLHAACPVITGTKWVANKWLYEYGQEFRRPCTLKNFKWGKNGALIVE